MTRPIEQTLDEQLQSAVRDVMSGDRATGGDVARVQEILDLKAAHMRAPFVEKVRRVKESP